MRVLGWGILWVRGSWAPHLDHGRHVAAEQPPHPTICPHAAQHLQQEGAREERSAGWWGTLLEASAAVLWQAAGDCRIDQGCGFGPQPTLVSNMND